MRKLKGRLLPIFGVVLLVVFIGVKLTSRGWISLNGVRQKAQVQQSQPLVWPPALADERDGICHTIKLSLEQLEKAHEEGVAVDQGRRCITRAAMAAYEAARQRQAAGGRVHDALRQEQAQVKQDVDTQIATGAIALQNLMEARVGRVTQISTALLPAAHMSVKSMPTPPSRLFAPMNYQSGDLKLQAFVTPDPRDGTRRPLMVWLTGGDTNSLDDFWREGSSSNDQSASAFRKAGMVMLYPTLRGGNDNPGQREYFWGEVPDVAAAILQAAQLPYVDASRIYLGGHSTGATLALLTATAGLPIQGVFAFGPVDEVGSYDWPIQWELLSVDEKRLRSPINWLHAIKSPTWIIEGRRNPGNLKSLEKLCAARKSVQVHCVWVEGADHFSVLQPMTRKIASQLILDQLVHLQSDEKL